LKLLTKQKCPNCEKDFDGEIDIDKLDLKPPKAAEIQASTEAINKEVTKQAKEFKQEVKTVAPPDQPFFKCKNCNDTHKNPNYTKQPNKKCQNCGTLNGSDSCKNCGSVESEELDPEELEDLGIPEPGEPKSGDHDHGI